MRTTRRLMQIAGVAAGVVGAMAVAAPESGPGRAARRLADRLARDIRYAAASAPGLLYKLAGRTPDPDVSDDIVADRIRSSLGPLEHKLDIPRVHVMVTDHYAILHGDVGDVIDAFEIEQAVLGVSGVDGVESHLHIGLVAGDTRPSTGSAATPPPSIALHRLLDAAKSAGATDTRAAVHAVLCGFLDRLPLEERLHVLSHLPADVQALSGPPRRAGSIPPRLRTVPQLVAAVTAQGGMDPARAEGVTRATLAELHALVPEEQRDIAAVLPGELREFWTSAATGGVR